MATSIAQVEPDIEPPAAMPGREPGTWTAKPDRGRELSALA